MGIVFTYTSMIIQGVPSDQIKTMKINQMKLIGI